MALLLDLVRKLGFLLPRALLVTVFMFALVVTVLSNFDIFEPYLPPLRLVSGPVREIAPGLVVGPYPHLDEMVQLKRKGVRVLYSLLDTSLPQEKALLERERANARRVGIEVRSFPMGYLPVNSERNRKTREDIVQALRDDPAGGYIHCYLGRHRVSFVAEGISGATTR